MVAADSGGQHYYAVRDKLGSVRGLVKRDGTWMFSERFRPYGLSVATSGTRVPLRYRWTGREYDQETGWYFHRSRYYDPSARRFVQEDPLGHGGSGNLYAYVAGRPLEATDPSGMMMKEYKPAEGSAEVVAVVGGGLAGIGDDLTEVFGSGAGFIPRAQAYARIAAWHEAQRIEKLFAATGIDAPLTLTTGNSAPAQRAEAGEEGSTRTPLTRRLEHMLLQTNTRKLADLFWTTRIRLGKPLISTFTVGHSRKSLN